MAGNLKTKTLLLAQAIYDKRDVLFGTLSADGSRPQTSKDKEDAWEAVRQEMLIQGYNNFETKSWREVRNHDWQYLRRTAVAKFEHNQRAGFEQLKYSEVDKLVFEIMTAGNNPSNQTISAENELKNEQQLEQSLQNFELSYPNLSSLGENLLPSESTGISANEQIPQQPTKNSSQLKQGRRRPQQNGLSENQIASKRAKLEKSLQLGHYEIDAQDPESVQLNMNNSILINDTLAEEYERNSDDAVDNNLDMHSDHSVTGTLTNGIARANLRQPLNRSRSSPFVEEKSSTSRNSSVLLNSGLAQMVVSQQKHSIATAFPPFAYLEEDERSQSIMLRIQREELLLQQERARLEQDKAKFEQEKAKFEQEKARFELERLRFESEKLKNGHL